MRPRTSQGQAHCLHVQAQQSQAQLWLTAAGRDEPPILVGKSFLARLHLFLVFAWLAVTLEETNRPQRRGMSTPNRSRSRTESLLPR